jgi:hypothetical protein
MGTNATDTSKLFGLGAGNISCFAQEFSMSGEYAIDDASGMCDGENVNVMGKQAVATLSANGRYEDGAGEIATAARERLAATDNEPVAILPLGAGHGLPFVGQSGLTTSVEVESPADGLSTISIEGMSDVGLDLGYQLGDWDAATTGDGDTAVLDGGAASASGGAAYLFITDFTGITAADVIIEDSADGSTGWATIATFTQVTATDSGERVEITGTIRQHTRASTDVTGTGSAKLAIGICRNNA